MGRFLVYGSRGVGGTARPRFDDGTSRARVSPRFAFFVHTAAICPAIQSCPALFTGGALGWPSIARLALTAKPKSGSQLRLQQSTQELVRLGLPQSVIFAIGWQRADSCRVDAVA